MNNITTDQLGMWLRTFASGFPLDSARLNTTSVDTDKKDITLRTSNTLQNLSNITTITFPSKTGAIPLSSLGYLSLEPNPTLITREDGKRTINVTGTVLKGYSPSTLNQG